MKPQPHFWKEGFWRGLVALCGLAVIVLTLSIGAFLIYKGSATFFTYGHSPLEFLFSSRWAPADNTGGGGAVGAAIYLFGSLVTCGLALAIAAPFSLAAAIFITDISPRWGGRVLQPAVELFVGIPSVIYGWVGLTTLVPAIKALFDLNHGYSVLAASLVLSVMIFPTITSVAADALRSVPGGWRKAAFGLGATRWQVIRDVVLPAARPGLLTGVVLGLARAFGEALAVAMVVGKTRAFPKGLLSPTTNLTSAIASDMGGAMEGGEYNAALWSMALVLFLLSVFFIFLIHRIAGKGGASGCEGD